MYKHAYSSVYREGEGEREGGRGEEEGGSERLTELDRLTKPLVHQDRKRLQS